MFRNRDGERSEFLPDSPASAAARQVAAQQHTNNQHHRRRHSRGPRQVRQAPPSTTTHHHQMPTLQRCGGCGRAFTVAAMSRHAAMCGANRTAALPQRAPSPQQQQQQHQSGDAQPVATAAVVSPQQQRQSPPQRATNDRGAGPTLQRCNGCGRAFTAAAMARHTTVCGANRRDDNDEDNIRRRRSSNNNYHSSAQQQHYYDQQQASSPTPAASGGEHEDAPMVRRRRRNPPRSRMQHNPTPTSSNDTTQTQERSVPPTGPPNIDDHHHDHDPSPNRHTQNSYPGMPMDVWEQQRIMEFWRLRNEANRNRNRVLQQISPGSLDNNGVNPPHGNRHAADQLEREQQQLQELLNGTSTLLPQGDVTGPNLRAVANLARRRRQREYRATLAEQIVLRAEMLDDFRRQQPDAATAVSSPPPPSATAGPHPLNPTQISPERTAPSTANVEAEQAPQDSIVSRCSLLSSVLSTRSACNPCSICLEELPCDGTAAAANGCDKLHTLPCGHQFHHKCIVEWCTRSNHCPNCRTPFN